MSRTRFNRSAQVVPAADFDSRMSSYSAVASAADVSARAAQPSPLSENGHRWTVYSTAVAAGLGILACVPAADGEIVTTKANIPIAATFSAIPPTPLDLNHDGVADLHFSRYIFGYYHSLRDNVRGVGANKAALVGTSAVTYKGWGYAAALKAGAPIGPSAHFTDKDVVLFARSFEETSNNKVLSQRLYGKWLGNNPERFLGVRFLIDGIIHYGWVRLTITSGPDKSVAGTITGYAYETIAGKTIKAGAVSDGSETDDSQAEGGQAENDQAVANHADNTQAPVQHFSGPTLGMLALGAHGLPLWRHAEAPPSN